MVFVALLAVLASAVTAQPSRHASTSEVFVSNASLRATVSSRTGAIQSVEWRGRGRLIGTCFQEWVVETETDEKLSASEQEDVVVGTPIRARARSGPTLSFVCQNSKLQRLGVRVEKSFELAGKAPLLTQTVRLSNQGDKLLYFEASTHVALASEFRAGGYYSVPFPHCTPCVEAKDVEKDTILYGAVYWPLHAAVCAFVNPMKGFGVASYLARAEGQPTFWGFGSPVEQGIERFKPVATTTGWRHYTYREFLKPGETRSYSVRLTGFAGDSRRLLAQFFESRERQELLRKEAPPPWIRDVKLMMFVTQAYDFNEATIKLWRQLSDRLGEGYLMPVFDLYGHIGGDFPLSGAEMERLDKMVRLARREVPNARIGAYVTLVLSDKTETYKAHPNWVVRRQKGASPTADFPGRHPVQLALPAAAEHFRSSFAKVVQRYNLDYLYLDGGDANAFDEPDWGNRLVAQFRHGYAMLHDLVADLTNGRPDRALFFNCPASLLADAGFQEMGGGQWSEEGDWRSLDEAMTYAKMATRYRAGTWVSHLYPYDLRKYFSFMLALALKPNVTTNNRQQLDEFLLRWLPYVNAAYEIRDAQLLDVDFSPNWRTTTTDLDVFALAEHDTVLLSALSFAKMPKDHTVSVNLRGTPLLREPRSTLFGLELALLDPTTRSPEDPAFAAPKLHVWDAPRQAISWNLKTEPFLVRTLILSKVPAWVKEVGGKERSYFLPQTEHVTLTGNWRPGSRHYTIVAQCDKPAVVVFWWPSDWRGSVVVESGKGRDLRGVCTIGAKCLEVRLPPGKHRVLVRQGR